MPSEAPINIDDRHAAEIGELILRCRKVAENEWDSLALVFDIGDGHSANSGFLYRDDKVRPVSAGIDEDPMLLSNKLRDFQTVVRGQCGQDFKQLLVKMEKKSGRIKIDFEFDDPTRWTMGPRNLRERREELRPSFE